MYVPAQNVEYVNPLIGLYGKATRCWATVRYSCPIGDVPLPTVMMVPDERLMLYSNKWFERVYLPEN